MSQTIWATIQDGVLKPDQPLDLPSGTRVRMIVEPLHEEMSDDQAWAELERLWDETHIDGGVHLTRDQLHERR
jgi:predicted DNA-binding antitoxin AbrB/MazE fold protein